ncbi:acetyltransferase [Clostridia bacterium]|nr:acetyltransferase [Clostridia bacterium]
MLREMIHDDLPALSKILQDTETMTAYEHPFNDEETGAWLDKQFTRYKTDGFGLWAVILKETSEMIGQCGLTKQDVDGKHVIEIGYLFQRMFWHKGYAVEAAIGCKKYAFETLKLNEVYSIIRDTNFTSMNVAIRNGMTVRRRYTKHYYDVDMPHYIFSARKGDLLN